MLFSFTFSTQGSEFEKETCDGGFAWAGNSLQDEDFALVDGARYVLVDDDDKESIDETNDAVLADGCTFDNGDTGACPMKDTVDAKAQEDGLAVEAVTVGVACNRLVAVACGENNMMCNLYDVSNINSPSLLKTFNLSPASRTKNPEQSYQDDLGDIDPETTTFVNKEDSPTGCTGIIFGGAISGTLSFYEFECDVDGEVAGDCVGSTSGAFSVSWNIITIGTMVASFALSLFM